MSPEARDDRDFTQLYPAEPYFGHARRILSSCPWHVGNGNQHSDHGAVCHPLPMRNQMNTIQKSSTSMIRPRSRIGAVLVLATAGLLAGSVAIAAPDRPFSPADPTMMPCGPNGGNPGGQGPGMRGGQGPGMSGGAGGGMPGAMCGEMPRRAPGGMPDSMRGGKHGHMHGHMHGRMHGAMRADRELGDFGGMHGMLRGLALTEEQNDRLFKSRHEAMPAMRDARKQARTAREALRSASMQPDADQQKIRALSEDLGRAVSAEAALRANQRMEMLAILTPEQASSVRERMAARDDRRRP